MTTTFLASSSIEFQSAAREELRRLDPKLEAGETLVSGLFLVSTSFSLTAFTNLLRGNPPVYIRHLFPVQLEIELENNPGDLEKLGGAAVDLARQQKLRQGVKISVQARLLEDAPKSYNPFAIKEAVVAALVASFNLEENIRNPEFIFSVVCTGSKALMGLSTPQQNLSSWAGGMRHYAKRPDQISRAEFKLLEALEVFDLKLPDRGKALDLGAAPGGWSKVLVEAGLSVTAVDPAALDTRLYVPGLDHFRGYAEDYLLKTEKTSRKFDLILNDMRMDALAAANIISSYQKLLVPSGFVLTTLKLPHETRKLKPAEIVNRAFDIMKKTYPVVRGRQLFHNRQEIMVLLAQEPGDQPDAESQESN